MLASGQMNAPPEVQQMAQMLQQMGMGAYAPEQQQDEQDRRWANMVYEQERLKAEGREPATGAEWVALLKRHGFAVSRPFSTRDAAAPMQFDVFAQKAGGWTLMESYEAQHEPDAPRKCDFCKVRGAKKRCSNCGEFYCSADHARRHWRDHRETCYMAGRGDPRSVPPTMDEETYAVRVLGKRTTAAAAARPAPAAAKPPPVTGKGSLPGLWAAAAARQAPPPEPAPGTGKNAKKNKKKREKAKAAKAAGPEGGAVTAPPAGAGAADAPGYENVD